MEDYIQYLSIYPTCTEVQNPCLLCLTIIIEYYCMFGTKTLVLFCNTNNENKQNNKNKKNYRRARPHPH